MTDELTLDNYHEKTGYRFRVSHEQRERIERKELSREQAFAEFLAAGGANKLKPRKPEVPDSVYLSEGLTIDNFSEKVKEATGTARRFRMSRDQSARYKAGTLTREQALLEIIESVKAASVAEDVK